MVTSEELGDVRESILRDDGQNVHSDLLEPCPFCGSEHARIDAGGERRVGPYVQVGPVMGFGPRLIDARVVCGKCHVSTSRSSASEAYASGTDEDVTRLVAVAKAIADWNRRAR